MKTYLLGIGVSVLVLLAPTSAVFADEGSGGHVGGQESVGASIQVPLGARADFEINGSQQEDVGENEGSSTSENATSTPWMRGEKEGLVRHFGTTTPPGHFGTSTRDKNKPEGQGGNNNGNSHAVFAGFWSWLFGLPATTTIGDIRAQIEASTSASSTVQTSPNPGFLAHLFHFFGFGE